MKQAMTESVLTIAQWHEKTFPDATLQTQTDKFADELKELRTEMTKQPADIESVFMELADCAIVACGLCRWGMAGARAFASVVAITEKIELPNDINPVTMLTASIERKMEINRKRIWANNNGKYQHIEQGE